MHGVKQYYRPTTLDEALGLLRRENARPLAGGQYLLAGGQPEVQALVDLQALGLAGLAVQGGRLQLGAMLRLQQLVESPLAGPLLALAARREGPLTYRNAATVGGTIVTHATTSTVLLALLALDAEVELRHPDHTSRRISLDALLDDPAGALAGGSPPRTARGLRRSLHGGGLITGVTASAEAAGTAMAEVGRTPRDQPIVAAAVRLTRQGDTCGEVRIALGGVSGRPLRAQQAEARLTGQRFSDPLVGEVVAQAVADLQPPGDFRGSTGYRRAMAAVLMRRAVLEAWSKLP